MLRQFETFDITYMTSPFLRVGQPKKLGGKNSKKASKSVGIFFYIIFRNLGYAVPKNGYAVPKTGYVVFKWVRQRPLTKTTVCLNWKKSAE